VAEFDANGKFLRGPVILKVDAGPGRIVASKASITRRAEFSDLGLEILMGLPNATSVQQEMDALYGPFMSATYARGERLVAQKLKVRGAARRNGEATTATLTLGFDDLATIVNGEPIDEIGMRPFDNVFTKEKIMGSWAKIGFIPFTRKCLSNEKVRHELGQHVANVDLENLQEKYDGLVGKAEAQGFNAGVFDGAIPVAEHVQRVGDPDEQVRLLLEKKGAFSASSLWSLCGSRLANLGKGTADNLYWMKPNMQRLLKKKTRRKQNFLQKHKRQ
jgi:hypothetical protein